MALSGQRVHSQADDSLVHAEGGAARKHYAWKAAESLPDSASKDSGGDVDDDRDPGDHVSNGPGDHASKGPGDHAAKGPGDHAAKGPGDHASKGPGDHASKGLDDDIGPVDEGFSWVILAAAFFVVMVHPINNLSFGVFLAEFIDHYRLPQAVLGIMGAVRTCVLFLAGGYRLLLLYFT